MVLDGCMERDDVGCFCHRLGKPSEDYHENREPKYGASAWKEIERFLNLKFGRQNLNTARNKALFREKLVRSRKFALPAA
jgi:hypothetical protein